LCLLFFNFIFKNNKIEDNCHKWHSVTNIHQSTMPSGWKKNAKYFNHTDMTHSEYVTEKKKFRKWKKKKSIHGGPFIDSKFVFDRDDDCPRDFYLQDTLTENDKSMYTLYISKQYMKKSNNTFRKKKMGNFTRLINRKKHNYNKYNKCSRTHDKVYYNKYKKHFIQTTVKKIIKSDVKMDMCSICCETKSIKELFTVHCKGKRIGCFKKNQDKIICNKCRLKVNTCPYCRSHNLKCVKYKSERKYTINWGAVQEYLRKKQSKIILNNVSEFEWRKQARKKKYPNKLLWIYNGEVTSREGLNSRRRCDVYQQPRPLPLKLYKFYLNKNIEYSHHKNIDDEVYDTYQEIPERVDIGIRV